MGDSPTEDSAELSGFELQHRLGAGGMAEVFLAKKRGAEGTYKQLVVKRILPEHSKSRRFRHMFVEEAHLATRLNHPNIVQVYEFSDHGDEGLLLSMEYVEGVDLGRLARAARKGHKRLPPWVGAFIIAEVAKGLHYAHDRKDEGGLPLEIVHRDVSPQNILIAFGGIVKIADFGIASANLFREETGVLKGKYGYMSPEQARGEKVDRRSDIYALGIVFYELLTGKSPYGGLKDAALAEAVRRGVTESPSSLVDEIPEALDAIVMKATARRADDRYPTARHMSAAIARALLDNKQLVDNATLEELMAALVGEAGSVEVPPDAPQRTLAVVRRPRTSASEMAGGTAEQYASKRIVREVRHVAVIKLRMEGFDALAEVNGAAAAQRTVEATRSTLDDMAFKHGAVWNWDRGTDAIAVVGLLANPSRAPGDAAHLAVDVHEFLRGHSEDLPVEVRASIGIVRGIAAGERDPQGHLIDHTLHHPATYLAGQLSERTPFGRTWVAGGVYRLVRRDHRWSDGPLIQLVDAEKQNVPDRMRVYVLRRPLTSEEHEAELELNPTDLVGRDAERADLHAAYHRAVLHPGLSAPPPDDDAQPKRPSKKHRRHGELLARVVVGEMGIGKTALIDQFLGEAPDEARVFRVECSPVNMELPYATVSDLMREVTGVSQDDSYDDAVKAVTATLRPGSNTGGQRVVACLAHLVTNREEQLQDEDAARQHDELVARGVRFTFGAIASELPVIIVVDSLQWADTASLDLLQQVLQRRESLPVLTLLATRPEERVNSCIEGLMRIELKGLDPQEQIRLVQTRLGARDGVAEVCRELVPRVGGNPYFLLEMIDALLERGALEIVESDDGDETALVRNEERFGDSSEALPSTIEQLVGDRLRELPNAEHDVVDWLAVAGGPLSEPDLLALTRLADDEAISRLCARGLCDRRGRSIDFRHPLARDVAYNALEPVQRARMHRRLGEHLSTTPLAQGLSAAIVAQHLERGEAPRQASELYIEAAKAARGAHQTPLALRYFQRTLALMPVGDSRRLIAHEALERTYRLLGQNQERRTHLTALKRLARESRDARWLAMALARQAQAHLDEGAMANGLPVAQRAADLARFAKQHDVEVDALIILCELLRDLGDVNGALEACERALEVTNEGRVTPRARAEVLRAKGVLLRRAGRCKAAVEAHAEAIAVFKAVGARRREARARNALGFALFVLGRYEDAVSMCLTSIGIDVMIGGRFQVAKTLSNVGMSYARLGDAEHGLAYLGRAREAHDRYQDHDGHVDSLLVTASVLIETGDLAAAKDVFGDASALAAVSGSVYDKVHQLIVHALIARAEADPMAAAAYASEARQLAEGQALVSYHVYATAIEAAARVDIGDTQAGTLLSTTALGAVEGMEASEYGIEVRALCVDATLRALDSESELGSAPSMSVDVCRRAMRHVSLIASYIRDPKLRDLFFRRPPVKLIVDSSERSDIQSAAADAPHGAGF